MYKILLFISFFSAYFINIFAQQAFLLHPSDSLYTSDLVTSNGDEVTLTAYIENNTSDTIEPVWRILEISNGTPSNWEMTLCDNTQCPSIRPIPTSPIRFVLPPDSTSILKFGIVPYLVAGSSTIRVRIFASNSTGTLTSDTVITYKVDIAADPTSIRKLNTESLSIYPNPASNFIQIEGIENTSFVKTLEIYNIIGRKLTSKQISTTSDLNVDIQNYESGIYLVKLFDKSERVFYTKTFIKK